MPRTSDPIQGRTRKALHQRELFERGRARESERRRMEWKALAAERAGQCVAAATGRLRKRAEERTGIGGPWRVRE